MNQATVSYVQFMDGVAVEDKVRVFVAADLQTGNYNLSRMFYLRDDAKWYHWDAKTIVASVCVVASNVRTAYAIGRDGLISGLVSGGDFFEERIVEAGTGRNKYGYLSQSREIDGQPFVCGDQGQVYKRTGKGWIHIDEGLLQTERIKREQLSLNGIDGTSSDDLYVVGDNGKIFHFNGRHWTDVSFRTNVHLERVKCVNKQEIYVCGDHGTFLRGNHEGWEMIGDPEMEGNIWDIEPYNGDIYLAVEDTLMVYHNEELSKVETGLKRQIDAYRLSARNGVLWSIGESHLACFDGKHWTYVSHPDNE
ncbi:MAG: hypothetical protein JSS39_19255 [Nitrospira sp.]|nr:hypothetical protein [Nitrospira sp.]